MNLAPDHLDWSACTSTGTSPLAFAERGAALLFHRRQYVLVSNGPSHLAAERQPTQLKIYTCTPQRPRRCAPPWNGLQQQAMRIHQSTADQDLPWPHKLRPLSLLEALESAMSTFRLGAAGETRLQASLFTSIRLCLLLITSRSTQYPDSSIRTEAALAHHFQGQRRRHPTATRYNT